MVLHMVVVRLGLQLVCIVLDFSLQQLDVLVVVVLELLLEGGGVRDFHVLEQVVVVRVEPARLGDLLAVEQHPIVVVQHVGGLVADEQVDHAALLVHDDLLQFVLVRQVREGGQVQLRVRLVLLAQVAVVVQLLDLLPRRLLVPRHGPRGLDHGGGTVRVVLAAEPLPVLVLGHVVGHAAALGLVPLVDGPAGRHRVRGRDVHALCLGAGGR